MAIRSSRVVEPVDLHTMSAGTDDALVRASLKRGARGLVLEGTGCGNVPPGIVPGVEAALARDVPVVLVSRCPEGRLAPAYGYDGGGQRLRDLGVLYAQELPGPKARVKLMVALGATTTRDGLRVLFE
jgi:L-asparaginase